MADLKKIQVDGQLYDINVPDGKIGTDQLKDGRVALAENLVGRGSVPAEYTFRTAGGDADLGSGSALIKMLKGRTLVFNQLIENGNFADISGWSPSRGTVSASNNTLNYTVTSIGSNLWDNRVVLINYTTIVGHKYLWTCEINPKTTNKIGISQNNLTNSQMSNNLIADSWNKVSMITPAISTVESQLWINLNCVSGVSEGDVIQIRNVMAIDLTLMFGAGNEPATVAEFEALFPLDYYAYNAGQLLSVNATGIETVGFNAYNPETGKAILLGGHKYQVSGTYTALDFNGAAPTLDGVGCFTPSENGELTVTGGNNTDTCVHLVWSGYRNGEYEPYWSETRQLPITTLTGKKDGAGESVVIFGDGLKSFGNTYDEITAEAAVKRLGLRAYAEGDENDPTVLTDGTNTIYVLDTPETYVLDEPLTLVYEVDDFGTEKELPQNDDEPVTAPIRYEVQYAMNAVDTLRRLPVNYISKESMEAFLAELDSKLGAALSATVETTMTWDADNEKYTFSMTVTPNAEPEP